MLERSLVLAAAAGAAGAVTRQTTILEPVHGLVKIGGRGGFRHVKVGPAYLEIRLDGDLDSRWMVAVAKPPIPLCSDRTALHHAMDSRAGAQAAASDEVIDLTGLLGDVLRKQGARGVTSVVVLERRGDGSSPKSRRLGLILTDRVGSVAKAVDQLAAAAPREDRAALETLVTRAVENVEADGARPSTIDWHAFEAAQYVAANYETISHPDAWLCRALVDSWQRVVMRLGNTVHAIDVGTGPNLYTLLAALPHVRAVRAYEIAASNRRYLLRQRVAIDDCWRQWVDLTAPSTASDFASTVRSQLGRKLEVSEGSVFDLRPAIADVATMFFCAECITDDYGEFKLACLKLIRATRPDGALMCAFMLGSSGYETAGVPLPSVPISEEMVRDVFSPHLAIDRLERVPGGTDVRPGHDGMLFLFGWRR